MQTRQLIGFILGAGARPLAIYAGDVLTIGRDPQNMINFPDVLASRNHAVIESSAVTGTVLLRDLGSANGTWINEKRATAHDPVKLLNNDIIRIGGKMFSFVSDQPNLMPQAFGARVAHLETVKEGLMFKNGKVVEVSAQKQNRDTQKDVTTTQRVEPIKPVVSAARSSVMEATLGGSLADQNLAEILQFLHANLKTGELKVRGAKQDGLICLDQGNIYHAECGDRHGPPAIYFCARQNTGAFKFTSMAKAPDKPKNVNDPMMQIIFECCKRIDESELSGQ
jgi:pSer/pThr/pTyr-binding forkhead associated (FHA) protein